MRGNCSSTEKFTLRAQAIHGSRYDYSKVDYKNHTTKVIIICKEHGEFPQQPRKHIDGQGCPHCSAIANCAKGFRNITEEDVEFVKANYQTMKINELCAQMRRSRATVKRIAKANGLKRHHIRQAQTYNNCIRYSYFNSLQKGAKFRNLDFCISIEDIWNLYIQQEKKCALTGWELTFEGDNSRTASVDRIDSNIGYLPDNIQIVHKHINLLKMDNEEEWLYHMSKAIYLNLQEKYEKCEQSGDWEWDHWNDTQHPILFRGDKYELAKLRKKQQEEFEELRKELYKL